MRGEEGNELTLDIWNKEGERVSIFKYLLATRLSDSCWGDFCLSFSTSFQHAGVRFSCSFFAALNLDAAFSLPKGAITNPKMWKGREYKHIHSTF